MNLKYWSWQRSPEKIQVANKRADRLPTFPGRPNISCLVHTTGKHAVELQLYLYKHKPSFERCFWPILNMDSSHKQKRKPIYLFVRKWSKFLKNCLWQCLPWITQVWATIWILTPKQTKVVEEGLLKAKEDSLARPHCKWSPEPSQGLALSLSGASHQLQDEVSARTNHIGDQDILSGNANHPLP